MLNKIAIKYALMFYIIVVSSVTFAAPEFWVDVRSSGEFKGPHVSTAVNILYTDIAEQITSITTNKNAEIYLYCGSGRRAGIAQKDLQALGYTNVINVGGIDAALALEKTLQH